MDPKIIRRWKFWNQLPEAAQAERRKGKERRRKKLEQHRNSKHSCRGMRKVWEHVKRVHVNGKCIDTD